MNKTKTQICTISASALALFFAASLPALADDEPTYHKEIMPILNKYCMDCHHTGGPAPQSFQTYKEMRPWIRTSRRTIIDGEMPPWHLNGEVGKWNNIGHLETAEVELFEAWVKARAPEGEPEGGVKPKTYDSPWADGEPSKILTAPETEVAADGTDIQKIFVIAPDFAADTWLDGIEIDPGTAGAVWSLSVAAAPASAVSESDGFDLNHEDAKEHLAYWDRGLTLKGKYPEGSGVLIPKGWNLILLAHYKAMEEAATVQPRIGLHIPDEAPSTEIHTAEISTQDFKIPANSYDAAVSAEMKFDKAVTIHSLRPLMHYTGRTMIVEAKMPDGETKQLLDLEDYIHEFESTYVPTEPIKLPAGTTLSVSATYENSADNPNNPNMTIEDLEYGPAPNGERMALAVTYTQ